VRQAAAAANVVIAARALGKSKTLTTLVAMAILLLAFDGRTGGPLAAIGAQGVSALAAAGLWLMILATVLTVVSGLDYMRGAAPMLLGHDPDQR
jgi:phosphatidylglycerophosphate synthase